MERHGDGSVHLRTRATRAGELRLLPGPRARPDATSPGLLSPWLLLNTAPAVLKDQ